MIYLLLIFPGVLLLYFLYYKWVISKAVKTSLHYREEDLEANCDVIRESYREEGDFPYQCDIYRPVFAQGRLPIILFFHGETPDRMKTKPIDWALYRDYGRLSANRGFAGVVFNHRSTGQGKNAAAARSDLKTMVEWLKNKQEELGLDAEKIIIWSFSGAAYVGLNWILRENPEAIKAYIAYYAVLEGREEGESAIAIVKNREPGSSPGVKNVPILIAKAEQDMIKRSPKAADELKAAADDKGLPVTVIGHSSSHGFDGYSKTDETIEIIDRTLEFIRQILETP